MVRIDERFNFFRQFFFKSFSIKPSCMAYRFEGNNNAINGWAIDEIKVESVGNNELIADVITENPLPLIGQSNLYTIEVRNGGSNPQFIGTNDEKTKSRSKQC